MRSFGLTSCNAKIVLCTDENSAFDPWRYHGWGKTHRFSFGGGANAGQQQKFDMGGGGFEEFVTIKLCDILDIVDFNSTPCICIFVRAYSIQNSSSTNQFGGRGKSVPTSFESIQKPLRPSTNSPDKAFRIYNH
jgi:hypothetical protein